LLRPAPRYVLAWLLALGTAGAILYNAWILFGNAEGAHRNDGNGGHVTIDFGGQYLLGRMLVRGHARHLYDRTYLRHTLIEVLPRADEEADQQRSDVENLMSWLLGRDEPRPALALRRFLLPFDWASAVGASAALATTPCLGGPLYPPTDAFLYAPLAVFPPRVAYRMVQVGCVLLAFVSGLAFTLISRGRLWWPVATTVVLLFPGYFGTVNLAQNAGLTLVIVSWGWLLVARERPGWAGLVWGLLAVKPVWALAYLLVPILSRRWRLAAGMMLSGMMFCLFTIPWVGVGSWLDWLQVGADATQVYRHDRNWIELSRDVVTLPRRFLDLSGPLEERRDNLPVLIGGWCLLVLLVELTVRLSVLRSRQVRAVTGPGAAFLLLGAWLSCFHFMYYDVVLALLPILLLFTEPREYLKPRLVAVALLRSAEADPKLEAYYQPVSALAYPTASPSLPEGRAWIWVLNRFAPTVLVLLVACAYQLPVIHWTVRDFPLDTMLLMVTWAWCGWRVARNADLVLSNAPKPIERGADVGGAHEGLADQDGADAGRLQSEHVVARADAALAHEATVRRQPDS
jgi:hypothetical protein